MLSNTEISELVSVASEQLEAGLKSLRPRKDTVRDIVELYNNKVFRSEDNTTNIPFPFLASIVDELFSKIDNKPSVNFYLPNKKTINQKLDSAWKQESSSMRAGWGRKDRAEKKMALLTGRGISKIYASSAMHKYKSHYDLVDFFSFVADPTRGHLDEGMYHGEIDIFKTKEELEFGVSNGVYLKEGVKKIIASRNPTSADYETMQTKKDRLSSLGIDIQNDAYAGQKGVLFVEWVFKYKNEKFYLLFDPVSRIAIRAEKLKTIFTNNLSPYVSWAANYDEFNFWSKGPADDIYPIAEASRVILNNAIENEKRRTRPMRIVESGVIPDVNELMDYVPDNVVIANPGRSANIITLETPQVSASLDVAQYLKNLMQDFTGVVGQGVEEKDTKVGVFYGQLQREADRIGIINKSYSESYAEKGYRFFWGLKDHLTEKKAVEMLGKNGLKLGEITKKDLEMVDDVDDVIVSGGQAEQELNTIKDKQQSDVLAQLTGNPIYGQKLSPEWVIRVSLQKAGFEEEQINQALDVEKGSNAEIIEEADEAIASILDGITPKLNMGANVSFMQRILDYTRDNIDYIKLDKFGKEIGIDKTLKKQHDELLAYMEAHQKIVLSNARQNIALKDQQIAQQNPTQINIPVTSEKEKKAALATPFESPIGTPEATAEASQIISGGLS